MWVLPVTGIWMVLDAGYSFGTLWTIVTGALTMVPIAAILYMMVVKPT